MKQLKVSAQFYDIYISFISNKSNGYVIAGLAFTNLVLLFVTSLTFKNYTRKKKPVMLTIMLLSGVLYLYTFYELTAEVLRKTTVYIDSDKVRIQVQKPAYQKNTEINLRNQKYQMDFFMQHVYVHRRTNKSYFEKDTIYTLILLTEKDEYILLKGITHHTLPKYSEALRKVIKNTTVLPLLKGYTVKKENRKLTVIKHAEGISTLSIVVITVGFLIATGLGLSIITKKENPLAAKIFAGFIMLCLIAIPPFYIYESNKVQKELTISDQYITFTQKGSVFKWINAEPPPVHLSQGETIKDILIHTEKDISSSGTRKGYYEYPKIMLLTTGNQRMELNLFTTESYTMYRADILRKYLASLYLHNNPKTNQSDSININN